MPLELDLRDPLDQAGTLRISIRLPQPTGRVGGRRTSSEYSRKSPLDSQSEHAVKAWTTEWPDGTILTPPLSVERIQHGRSPVKNAPEKVRPGAGEVTNGMSCLEMRFCSANTDFSTSSDCWMSKARVTTLTNLTDSVDARVDGGGSVDAGAGRAS